MEVVRAVRKSRFHKPLPEDLEVERFEHARVLRDFRIVGVGLILSGLMSDQGNGRMRNGGREITHCSASRQLHVPQRQVAVGIGTTHVPLRTAGAPKRAPEIVAGVPVRFTVVGVRTLGVQGARVVGPQGPGDFHARIPPARGFVAEGEHHERRMVSIGVQDPFRLVEGEAGDLRIRPVPAEERQFGLKVEAEFVRRLKRGIRRTPRMEAHVVEAVVLHRPEVRAPRLDIHRCGPRERPHAGIVPSPEERRPPVDRELRSPRAEFAQPDLHPAREIPDPNLNFVQDGTELAPQRGILGEGDRLPVGRNAVRGEDLRLHVHRPGRRIREKADASEARQAFGAEFDPSEDAVPVRLRVLRNLVTRNWHRINPVVHLQSEDVTPRLYRARQFEDGRRGKCLAPPEADTIPKRPNDLRTLEEKRYPPPLPRFGNLH